MFKSLKMEMFYKYNYDEVLLNKNNKKVNDYDIHTKSSKKKNLNHKNKKRTSKAKKRKETHIQKHNHHFDTHESFSEQKISQSANNLKIYEPNYRKYLFKKYSNFLNKKKFTLSNVFDEKHCKKFLDKKNKCLEEIILSDEIKEEENDKKIYKKKENNESEENSNRSKKFTRFNTDKNVKKYYIVISDYDEELRSKKNNKKTSLFINKEI